MHYFPAVYDSANNTPPRLEKQAREGLGMVAVPHLVQNLTSDDRINQAAERLGEIHGLVNIRSESSGLNAYMACPACLVEDGRKELSSRHLAINLEKYLGIGKFFRSFRPNAKKVGYAMCMKCSQKFDFPTLLAYPPLEDRGYIVEKSQLVVRSGELRYLVPDANGEMIPDHPGTTKLLTALPSDHPAILFLKSRDFDPIKLVRQFRASWCETEAPVGDQYNRWYRKHPGGWKSTPQQRIIFYCDVGGVQCCWQGRYLEIDSIDDVPLVWHPYTKEWTIRPEWLKGEEPAKYNTATGSFRNSQLCGYDAVVRASQVRGGVAQCVLGEGPLDAARFPEHGLGVLGKHLSEAQALLVASNFRQAILAFDADQYGFKTCAQASEMLAKFHVRTRAFFRRRDGLDAQGQPTKMDPGKMTYEAAEERRQQVSATFDMADNLFLIED